jgi:predicted metal-dependent hydrolase
VLRRLFTPATPPEPEQIGLIVRDRPVVVTVKRTASARRMTLRIKGATGEVVLTLPARASFRSGKAFVERQVDWIAARLEQRPAAKPFVEGAEIPLRGEPHVLAYRGLRGVTRVEPGLRGQPPVIAVSGPREHFSRRVTDFLKREAKRDLDPAVARHAAALNVAIGRISVKDTTSRWGSCSAKGGLAFSWRLILAPPFVLNYLAAHEVAHRREMNHGQAFWDLVHRLCAETDAAERWLKKNGVDLHRYGAEE